MSTPLATADDLALYLEIESINTARAGMLLQMAQDLCESIVTPLPATAKAVVLAVAARPFTNPTGSTQEAVGPYSVQRPGGLYLSRADKSTLRRLAGGGGAFSIDTMPPGVSAVQAVTCTATAGTFRLAFAGQFTVPIAYNASAATVQAALEAVPSIGAGNVTVTGTWTVAFVNALATTPVPTFTADVAALTGAVVVTVIKAGVYRPGQGLAPWDFDYAHLPSAPLANGIY